MDRPRRLGLRDEEGRLAVGYRVAAYLVATMGASFAVQQVVFGSVQRHLAPETPQQLYLVGGWPYLLVVATIGLLITIWFRTRLDRRTFRGIGLTTVRPRRAVLLAVLGLLGAVVAVAAIVAVNVALGLLVVHSTAWNERSLPVVLGLSLAGLGFAMSTGFFEELQYRGYVLANLGERLPLWAAGLILSAIFTPLHYLVNPGFGALLTVLVTSMTFVALRAVSGSLWLPIGFHVGYNWAYNQAFPDLALPALISGEDTRLSSPAGWLVDLAVQVVVFVVVAVAGRRRIHWRAPVTGPGPVTTAP